MSKANKCDRCGKFYTENSTDNEIKGVSVTGIRIFAEGNVVRNFIDLDLCDDCVFDLYAFLYKNGDKKEENK